MNAKPQTPDPGESHSTNSKNGGDDAFALPVGSQDDYDYDYDIPGDGQNVSVPVRVTDTSNPCNGSGGSSKVIDPSRVKGINP